MDGLRLITAQVYVERDEPTVAYIKRMKVKKERPLLPRYLHRA